MLRQDAIDTTRHDEHVLRALLAPLPEVFKVSVLVPLPLSVQPRVVLREPEGYGSDFDSSRWCMPCYADPPIPDFAVLLDLLWPSPGQFGILDNHGLWGRLSPGPGSSGDRATVS